MSHGFVQNGNARTIGTPPARTHGRRMNRPRVIIGGPEALSHQESLCISDSLKGRGADVDVFRITSDFRIAEFIAALDGCSWLLLAIGEFPGRELEMLREAQCLVPPVKIGIICLKDRVQTSGSDDTGGIVEMIVRKTHLDRSLVSFTRTNHLLIAENLLSENWVLPIARTVVPDHVFNAFR